MFGTKPEHVRYAGKFCGNFIIKDIRPPLKTKEPDTVNSLQGERVLRLKSHLLWNLEILIPIARREKKQRTILPVVGRIRDNRRDPKTTTIQLRRFEKRTAGAILCGSWLVLMMRRVVLLGFQAALVLLGFQAALVLLGFQAALLGFQAALVLLAGWMRRGALAMDWLVLGVMRMVLVLYLQIIVRDLGWSSLVTCRFQQKIPLVTRTRRNPGLVGLGPLGFPGSSASSRKSPWSLGFFLLLYCFLAAAEGSRILLLYCFLAAAEDSRILLLYCYTRILSTGSRRFLRPNVTRAALNQKRNLS